SAPLAVKNVSGVPSGPTNVSGPVLELLAATWDLTAVPAGAVASNESVVHVGVAPAGGSASFTEDTSVPDDAYAVPSQMRNPASLETPPVSGTDHCVPLDMPAS